MTDPDGTATLPAERETGLCSGSRAAVHAAIDGLPRDRLARWLGTARGAQMLHDAFQRMPGYYVPGLNEGRSVARWRVRRPPGEQIEYDLVMDADACTVGAVDPARPAAVTLTFESAGFVEMACAARTGVELLLHGRLHIQGDVQLAMRMERIFGLDAGARR
jgi:SCP-2 sterol transfer family protein